MLSVLGQDYPDLEYIVIDGASTDGTQQIISKYQDRLAYWVSEPDRGIYDAMNKGVSHATGQWVNFMNAGDTFADPGVLADIFGHGIGDEVLLIGGNTINFFADGREERHLAESASVIPERLPFSHQASFVRRGVCQFDTDYRLAADYALFYRLYYKHGAGSIMAVDRDIARYRQEGSTTMQNPKMVKGEYLAIQAYHISWRWIKEYIKWRWF